MTTALLIAALYIFIEDILFYIEALLCWILDVLYGAFEIFAGIRTVIYNGSESYLMSVFFSNDVISAVFWGMAVIGFAMTFGFAIAAVVKKLFDSTGEKVKTTYGQILVNVFKAFLLILLMTAVVSATINASGILMQQIDYIFDNAIELSDPSHIEFDDTDMATMFRIMNTIGNYSLNPSYKSRFNINSCFNAIRPDMQILAKTGAFKFTYKGAESSWQYALAQIYSACDIETEVDIDSYNEILNEAMLGCIEQIKTNKQFKPLKSYDRDYSASNLGAELGRTVMLTATLEAANNVAYNYNPSLMDNLRRPYYFGEKDIYDKGEVTDDFSIDLFEWNHITTILASFFLVKEFAVILFNCVARMFNIILLYIAAPGFISVMPLDDGGKMKQWTIAFTIQSLSIFGSVLAVRLLMIFIPVIMGPELVLFPNSSTGNYLAKLVLLLGVCKTSEKANGMISGILADNAGYQSIMAGDVGSGLVQKGLDVAKKVGTMGAKAGFAAGKAVMGGVANATGLQTFADKISGGFKNFGQSMRDKGGFFAAKKSGFKTNEQDAKDSQKKEKEAEQRNTQDFRNKVLTALGNMGGGVSPGGGTSGGSSGSGTSGVSKGGTSTGPRNNNSTTAKGGNTSGTATSGTATSGTATAGTSASPAEKAETKDVPKDQPKEQKKDENQNPAMLMNMMNTNKDKEEKKDGEPIQNQNPVNSNPVQPNANANNNPVQAGPGSQPQNNVQVARPLPVAPASNNQVNRSSNQSSENDNNKEEEKKE